jgi:anti-sigma factor RsiW
MTCEEVVNILSDYIENCLDEALTIEVRAHIEACPRCHILLDTTEKMIAFCRKCSKQTMPFEHRQRILSQLQEELEQRQKLL